MLACEQALHVNHVELRTKPAWWERPTGRRGHEGLNKRTARGIIMYKKHRRIVFAWVKWNTIGWKMTHRQPDAPPRAACPWLLTISTKWRAFSQDSSKGTLPLKHSSTLSLTPGVVFFFFIFVTHIAKQLKIILLSDKAKIAFSPYFWPKTEKKKLFS